MKDINKFEIGSVKVTKDIKINELVQSGEFQSDNETERKIRFVTSPEEKSFLGAYFYVRLIFKEEYLYEIELTPIIKGLQFPGYPDEEYEMKQFKFNCDILRAAYGEPDELSDSVFLYDTEEYIISTYRVIEGRELYTGGNIVIRVK